MQDTNSILFFLQTVALTVSATLFLILTLSRFHNPDTSKAYEQVRWLLAAAMLLLAIHYGLQMIFGFRAKGDDVGALVNILFYSPVSYALAYSMVRIGSAGTYHRRFIWFFGVSMLLIFGCLVCGYLYYGSIHMTGALHAMGLLYFITIVINFIYPMKEIRRTMKKLDEESGIEPVQFKLYMNTSSIFLQLAALLTTFSIFYTYALVAVGPLFLIALVFYIDCFVALGFNIRHVKSIITETEAETEYESAESNEESEKSELDNRQKEYIQMQIDNWRQNQGYAVSEISSTTLAVRLNVSKRNLMQYIREVEGKTFRVWLSDLRLEEAKRLISEHPEYSNETIAEACGFSRSHLQVKFKEATGLTIKAWREAMKG